jgi:hypothetical protein
MKARHSVIGFLGFLLIVTLIVPTAGAHHNAVIADLRAPWNDTGINTRIGPVDTSGWNDAGVDTRAVQIVTMGWNDVAMNTRPTPNNIVDWSDAGTKAGRMWFYSAAKG